MSLPIRETIIQAIIVRVNGHRGLESYDARDLDDGPITIVVVGEDVAEGSDYDMTRLVMPVTLARGKKASGGKSDQWYTEANIELASLISEMYATDAADELIVGMDYQGGGVALLTDGAKGFTCQASFNIRYAHLHGDPYHNTED